MRKARAAVRCLINVERSKRGMRKLGRSRALARAATGQSRSMVRHGYFGHKRPGGPDFAERIRRSGYMSGAGSWEVAENIAWGAAERGTPAAIVGDWMASADHRHNILDASLRQIGVGIARGTPDGNRSSGSVTDAMVVTADFGSHR